MDSNFPLDFSNFELEITNRCNLGCPRCARTDLIRQFPKAWKNSDLDIDLFSTFISSVIDKIKIFEFKGTMGDPIFHPKFIDWIKWAKEKGKQVFIHTNGQAGKALWIELAKHLDKNDRVILGIDGMPTSFMTYRVHANWKNIESCVEGLRGKTTLVWQFIHFSYNAHEIEDARALSIQMGFDEFVLIESDRWESVDDWLKPQNAVHDRPSFKQDIDPQCLSKPMHIVTADGYYMPCCMLVDHRFRYKTHWAKTYHISKYYIDDIINSSMAVEFFAKLTNKSAPDYCRFNCGKCNGI